MKALAVYDVGKPILIEKMFPLNCPIEDPAQFIDRSKPIAAGWIGFHWGETSAEYQQKAATSDAIAPPVGWFIFPKKRRTFLVQTPRGGGARNA